MQLIVLLAIDLEGRRRIEYLACQILLSDFEVWPRRHRPRVYVGLRMQVTVKMQVAKRY